VIYTFISISPFRRSPLSLLTGRSNLSTERIHNILLAYLRLLTADPNIATRLEWSTTPLRQLRAHADTGVKLLCILVIAKQQGLSEEKRMELEREWIGDVKGTDARVFDGCCLYMKARGRQSVSSFRLPSSQKLTIRSCFTAYS
jgi:hypothetical protein